MRFDERHNKNSISLHSLKKNYEKSLLMALPVDTQININIIQFVVYKRRKVKLKHHIYTMYGQ